MKNKLMLIIFIGYLNSSFSPSIEAATTNSSIDGEITSGEFTLNPPNDLKFQAKLDGKKQKLQLAPIKTKVIDYRGVENGWQIVVKSSNYNDYKASFDLLINGQQISDNSTIIFKQQQQKLIKEATLPTQVMISANAKAGVYGAKLEWNLQPTITNSITE